MLYQQHHLIKDYREQLYGQLYIIQKPIEEILSFQKTAEQYDDEQRVQLFEPLVSAYSDIFNFTGGGLQLEPHIKKLYFSEYNDTKLKYTLSIQAYEDAATSIEREQAHTRLKEQYEDYKEFLRKAERELVEPLE